MTPQAFDPAQHILVVRDKDTGKHVHVTWSDVLAKVATPAEAAKPLDLSDLYRRLAAVESIPVQGADLAQAVADAAARLSILLDRVAKLEVDYRGHSHDYKIPEAQLQVIAAAVLEQMRLAGVSVTQKVA